MRPYWSLISPFRALAVHYIKIHYISLRIPPRFPRRTLGRPPRKLQDSSKRQPSLRAWVMQTGKFAYCQKQKTNEKHWNLKQMSWNCCNRNGIHINSNRHQKHIKKHIINTSCQFTKITKLSIVFVKCYGKSRSTANAEQGRIARRQCSIKSGCSKL